MPKVNNLRILVADDRTLFRVGLKHLLGQFAKAVTVFEADDGERVLSMLSQGDPVDLVLIDPRIRGIDGFAGLERLRARARGVPILVVSFAEGAADVRAALAAGAAGYLPKTASPEALFDAVRLVLSGGIYLPVGVLAGVPRRHLAGGNQADYAADNIVGPLLTARQRDVLALLAEGMSNKEIANVLGLAAGTVKIHVAKIFKALNVGSRTRAIVAARELARTRTAVAAGEG